MTFNPRTYTSRGGISKPEPLATEGRLDELTLNLQFLQERVASAERSDRELYESVGRIMSEISSLTTIAKKTQDELFRIGTKFDAYVSVHEHIDRSQDSRLDTLSAWQGSIATVSHEELLARLHTAEKELAARNDSLRVQAAWWRKKTVKALFFILAILASVATGAGVTEFFSDKEPPPALKK